AAVVLGSLAPAARLDGHLASRIFSLLGMAGARTLLTLWRAPGRIPLVRSPQALRKRGRLHCLGVVLLLTANPSQQRAIFRATGDGRSLGRVRYDLHCHCSGPHFVCSARGRAVELAPHFITRTLISIGHRLSVFADHPASPRARIHAVSRAHPASRSSGNMGGSL